MLNKYKDLSQFKEVQVIARASSKTFSITELMCYIENDSAAFPTIGNEIIITIKKLTLLLCKNFSF